MAVIRNGLRFPAGRLPEPAAPQQPVSQEAGSEPLPSQRFGAGLVDPLGPVLAGQLDHAPQRVERLRRKVPRRNAPLRPGFRVAADLPRLGQQPVFVLSDIRTSGNLLDVLAHLQRRVQ